MSSPFSSLLHTNYTPSDDEIRDIKKMVASRCAAMEGLDETIRALTEERERHAKFIEDHNALTAPFRRLPTDILSLIFLSYLDQCRWRASYHGRQHPSILLTHICHRWREVARATPLLWTLVRIQIPKCLPSLTVRRNKSVILDRLVETWVSKMRAVEETLAMCLERSAGCPLQLSVESSEYHFSTIAEKLSQTHRDSVGRVISTICQESRRWERLDIHFSISSTTSPVYQLLRLPAEDVPLLRSIQIYWSLSEATMPSEEPEPTVCDVKMVGGASLRTLRWGIALNKATLSAIPVSWEYLTDLFLGAEPGRYTAQLGFEDALTLLSKCPRLVHCTLALRSPEGRHRDSPMSPIFVKNVSLPRLQTLGLRALKIPPGLSERLSLPCLHTLHIYEGQWSLGLSGETNGLVEFIRGFSHQLKDVSFNYATLSQEGLLACLKSLQGVTRLQVIADCPTPGLLVLSDDVPGVTPSTFDNATLGELTPTYDARGVLTKPCYCPLLEDFCCHVEGKEFSEQALVRFITSRRNIPDNARRNVTRLVGVTVKYDLEMTLDVREALRREGVDMGDGRVNIISQRVDTKVARNMDWGTLWGPYRYGNGVQDYREDAGLRAGRLV